MLFDISKAELKDEVMKKLVMLMCGTMISLAMQAQPHEEDKETIIEQHISIPLLTAASVITGYACPICLWNSAGPGQCVFHNVELVPDGWFYCKTDVSVMSANPGKCPKCGIELTLMKTGILNHEPGMTMVQDTSRKPSLKKPEETGNDPQLNDQMRKDPDNRLRTKPKTVPAQQDSTAAPGK
jgi:hypothetical protein